MVKDNNSNKGKGTIKNREVHFNLKSKKAKNKATLIVAKFRYSSGRLVYSTQHNIKPSQWNDNKHRPYNTYKHKAELVEDLVLIENAILKIYKENKSISIAAFKHLLNIELNRKQPSKGQSSANEKTLFGYIEYYINRKEENESVSPRTIQKYKSEFKKLKRFSIFLDRVLDFDDIDFSFLEDYEAWMYKHTKVNSKNTANKSISTLKEFLSKAYRDKKHKNDIFKDRDFTIKRAKTTQIALDEEEIDQLYNYDFSKIPRLEFIVDWFLVACFSSMRYSDFTNISKSNIIKIEDDFYIEKVTQKTAEEVYIPINENLFSILEKYDYQSPKITSQKFNKYIKEACEIAGITKVVKLLKQVKGKPEVIEVRKCDVVSSHDGRRSWASINYAKGFPILLLMQVTGHQKESTFLTYLGINRKELAAKLMKQMKEKKHEHDKKIININRAV